MRIKLTVAIIFLLAGCSGKPTQQVPDDQLILVLRDLQTAHLYVNSTSWTNARKDTIGAQLYADILARHKVDRHELRETFRYFASHPTEFEKLLGRTVDSANVQVSHINAREPANPQPAQTHLNVDSVQKAKRDSLRNPSQPKRPSRTRRIPNQRQTAL